MSGMEVLREKRAAQMVDAGYYCFNVLCWLGALAGYTHS